MPLIANQLELTQLVIERFESDSQGRIWREVKVGPKSGPRMCVKARSAGKSQDQLRAAWDQAWLRGQRPAVVLAKSSVRRPQLRVVDLFAGCGSMSLGVSLAAEALGLRFASLLAADMEEAALRVYEANLKPMAVFEGDIADAIDFKLGKERNLDGAPRLRSGAFYPLAGRVDVLIGGPPCQGHSDLNNYSRRDDPKNSLYFLMAAMAVSLRPKAVIVENVPSVVHDRSRVVARSKEALIDAGYSVDELVVPMSEVGVAQRRKRHILVAVEGNQPIDLRAALSSFTTKPRPVSWAIGDLLDRNPETVFDSPSTQNEVNRRRIDWLFEHDEYDLPNDKRPECHQDDSHSYLSMYGRMRWEEPAQTVTSGFGSPGQGRYIHPRQKRTLTPHEAARLQFIPDSFAIDPNQSLLRSRMAVMIGNAVPPKLSYVIGLIALSMLVGG